MNLEEKGESEELEAQTVWLEAFLECALHQPQCWWGKQGAELHPQEIWQGEFISREKKGAGLGSSFLRCWESTWKPCTTVPAKSHSQMYGVWLLFQGSERCEICSGKTQSCPSTNTAIWFDVTHCVYSQ